MCTCSFQEAWETKRLQRVKVAAFVLIKSVFLSAAWMMKHSTQRRSDSLWGWREARLQEANSDEFLHLKLVCWIATGQQRPAAATSSCPQVYTDWKATVTFSLWSEDLFRSFRYSGSNHETVEVRQQFGSGVSAPGSCIDPTRGFWHQQ